MKQTEIVIRPRHTLEGDCLALALRGEGLLAVHRRSPAAVGAVLMQTRDRRHDVVGLARGLEGIPTLIIVEAADLWATADSRAYDAAGVVSWEEEPRTVARAIHAVVNGDPLRRAVPPDTDPCRRMTDRELDVLTLVVLGRRDDEIGDALGISINTVRTHVQHALMKLDVNHRRAAATVARDSVLIRARLTVRGPQPGGAP